MTSNKFTLTPSYAVVCPEWRRPVEHVRDDPRVQVGPFDEHPEHGGDVAVQQEDEDDLAKVALEAGIFK